MSSVAFRTTKLSSITQTSCRLASSSSSVPLKPTSILRHQVANVYNSDNNSRHLKGSFTRWKSASSLQNQPKSESTTSSSSTSSSPPPHPDQQFPAPYFHPPPSSPTRSAFTKWILASRRRTDAFLKFGDILGYGSPRQVSGRRAFIIYNVCAGVAEGSERTFWYDSLFLPRSFQSWFTITNLHVWLATVRLRALPPSHGRFFVQALIDHFFLDVEERVRAVLGKKAPERLVTRHMKILREQWAGLGLACDAALITGDKDMASAMWRNLLGARGATGIAYPERLLAPSPSSHPASQDLTKIPNDPSNGGIIDFEGPGIDKYVQYPQLMLALTSYLRRELVRLETITDATILGGEGRGMRESVYGPASGVDESAKLNLTEAFKFGSVKSAAKKIGVEVEGF